MSITPHLDQSVRLLQFLREYVQLRSKIVQDVDSYAKDGAVKWFSKMPRSAGCKSPAWDASMTTETWLQVQKQQLPDPPDVPPLIEEWIENAGDAYAEPSLKPVIYRPKDTGEDEETELEPHHLADYPEVENAWPAFFDAWNTWATEYRRRDEIRQLYLDLFKMYELLSERPEDLELVVGLGLYVDHQQSIRRHFIEAKAELAFDKSQGLLSLRAAESAIGDDLRLEDEFISNKPQARHYRDLREELSNIGTEIWNNADFDLALIGWTNALGNVDFKRDFDLPSSPNPAPAVYFAPALILRKRNLHGQLKMIGDMITHGETQGQLPKGLLRFVGGDESSEGGPEYAEGSGVASNQSRAEFAPLYFPLPSNEQQSRIIQRLAGQQGVLVQGPPGTGKSHTIANLICHLLATGKRVLVTSETPKALAVLKAKLPDELKPLCVSAISERDTSGELNAAVNTMVERHSFYDQSEQDAKLHQLEAELDACRRREAEAYKALLSVREAETHKVTLAQGTYSGTATQIAQQLANEESDYGWIRDHALLRDDPPLERQQAEQLADLLEAYSPEAIAELRKAVPSSGGLLTKEQFARLLTREAEASQAWSLYADLEHDAQFHALLTLEAETRARLFEAVAKLEAAFGKLKLRGESWLPTLIADVRMARLSHWETICERTANLLGDNQLPGEAQVADSVEVDLPEGKSGATVLEDATAVWRHLRHGGQWRLLGVLPSGPVKSRTYLRSAVRVDGQPADTVERLNQLITFLTVKRKLEGIWNQWQHIGATRPPSFQLQVAELRDNLSALHSVWNLKDAASDLASALKESGLPSASVLPTEDDISALLRLESAVETHRELSQSRNALEQLETKVAALEGQPDTHRVVTSLLRAIRQRDPTSYTESIERIGEIENHRLRIEHLAALITRLDDAAPGLAERLRDLEHEECRKRLSLLAEAWRWGQARHWLVEWQSPGKLSQLNSEYKAAQEGIAALTAALSAERAWKHFMERLTEQQRKHLQAWKDAVKKIPKTLTAKTRPKFVRAAKEHMEACIPAVPAWIMPRFRLSDTLRVAPEMFDVVIIDEASQTGIDGLTLPFLARKVVVVGDDKQISPSGVGVKESDIAGLVSKYLSDNPFKAMFTATHSLYDHATVHYGDRIPLREHFRCMPEIIAFSNQLCYAPDGIPLIPLRNYPPERLEPLESVYVQDGYQQGSGQQRRNPPEAEALVKQVLACHEDARYECKSFGVISLLGGAQAELIRDLLLERLGPEAMDARKIVCGDAYAFQGDERDVIFLSVVSAPSEGRAISALTGASAIQRFNVAASRARDQMWLFHSALMEHLSPNPECVRRRMLEFFLNPASQAQVATGLDVPALRRLSRAQPRPSQPPKPFDSWFEVEVFLDIAERGFRVTPQVEFAGYRIDLVIEGRLGRLAVECDGDYWHGPAQYEKDMARQRQLERAGWTFWRIRSSEYYFNRDEVMAELWAELGRRGIAPPGPSATSEVNQVATGGEVGANSRADSERLGMSREDSEAIETISGSGGEETEPEATSDFSLTDEPELRAYQAPKENDTKQQLLNLIQGAGSINAQVLIARFLEESAAQSEGMNQRDVRNLLRDLEIAGSIVIERVKHPNGAQTWGMVYLKGLNAAVTSPEGGIQAPSEDRDATPEQPEKPEPPVTSRREPPTQELLFSGWAELLQNDDHGFWGIQALAEAAYELVRKETAIKVKSLYNKLKYQNGFSPVAGDHEAALERALNLLVSSHNVSLYYKNGSEVLIDATVFLPEIIERVQAVPSNTWFDLAQWAKENNQFESWERRLLYTVGKYLATVTPKQAAHALRLYQQGLEGGFLPDPGPSDKNVN